MEPVTIVKVAETIQKVAEAVKKIQKIYNVSKEVKSVAESEGKDQIQATSRVASSVESKLPSIETKGLEKNRDFPSRLETPRGWGDFPNSDMPTLKEGSPCETLKERPSLFDEGLPLIDEKLPSPEVPSKGMTLDKGGINIFVEEMSSTGRELPKPKFSDEMKPSSEDIRSSNTNIYDAIPQRESRSSTEFIAERGSESNESEATANHVQVQERPESQYSAETSEEPERKREGLTEEQKKEIKEKTGWSDRIIDSIRTMDEAEIYMNAGLQEGEINGKPALLQPKIDGSAYNEPKWSDWSNKDLAEEGYPPRDETGKPYELHHIGQNPDSPLAELTHEQHHSNGNFKKLHTFDESLIDRQQFNQERKEYWKARSQTL